MFSSKATGAIAAGTIIGIYTLDPIHLLMLWLMATSLFLLYRHHLDVVDDLEASVLHLQKRVVAYELAEEGLDIPTTLLEQRLEAVTSPLLAQEVSTKIEHQKKETAAANTQSKTAQTTLALQLASLPELEDQKSFLYKARQERHTPSGQASGGIKLSNTASITPVVDLDAQIAKQQQKRLLAAARLLSALEVQAHTHICIKNTASKLEKQIVRYTRLLRAEALSIKHTEEAQKAFLEPTMLLLRLLEQKRANPKKITSEAHAKAILRSQAIQQALAAQELEPYRKK